MPRSQTKGQSELQTAAVKEHLDACLKKRTLQLPMLARVVSEAMELCNAPDTGTEELSAVLHRDQNLAGQVLRVANSPLVRPATPIVSLEQAIPRLGLRQVMEIVLTASLRANIFDNQQHERVMLHFWKHAVATGCFVREIAGLLRDHGNGYFICGLFHNVGKPMVLNALASLEKTLGKPVVETDVVMAINEYHIALGAELARSWNLPEQVEKSILYYRDYAAKSSFRDVATMVNLASQLGDFLVCSDGSPEPEDAVDFSRLPVCHDLDFSANDIDTLLGETDKIRATVQAML
ncbi:MAG: HDOD domain-containing protein [Planctomycetota bacterium]